MKKTGMTLLRLIGELDEAMIEEASSPMIPVPAHPLLPRSPEQPVSPKKGLLLRRVAVIVAAVLLLCGLTAGILILDRRDPGYSAEKVPLCHTNDPDEFIEHWKNTHVEQGMDFLVVPVLKTDRYRFVEAEENDYNYFYYFAPADWVGGPNAPSFYDVGIIVTLSKSPKSYEGVLGQYGLTDQNGKAYYPKENEWFVNVSWHRLSVDLPNGGSTADFSAVTQMFSFVMYTMENGAVCKTPLFAGDDLQAFIDVWRSQHQGDPDAFLLVPVLLSHDYYLSGIREDENAYRFIFRLVNDTDNAAASIHVNVSKEGGATFEAVVAQYEKVGIKVTANKAYLERSNDWFIDYQGTLLHINLPREGNDSDYSAVTDLFSFERYSPEGEKQTVTP